MNVKELIANAHLAFLNQENETALEFKQIPGLSNLVGEKTAQFGFRDNFENLVGAFALD